MSNCYVSHRSPWMFNRTLEFLQNFLSHYEGMIRDSDVFAVFDQIDGMDSRLEQLVRKTIPASQVKNMETTRHKGFLLEMDDDDPSDTLCGLWNCEEQRKNVRRMMPALVQFARENPPAIIKCANDNLVKRLDELQALLKLDAIDRDILAVLIALQEHFLWIPGRDFDDFGHRCYFTALCLNRTDEEVIARLGEKAPLRRFRCVDSDLDICYAINGFLDGATSEPLANSYFRKFDGETLPWNDFDELAHRHGTILKRLLTADRRPVNILLYGAPGTGKTSFAQTLAREIGRTCYTVAQETSERSGRTVSTPDFRFGALQVCDAQVAPESSVIIVDEADDMLRAIGGGVFAMLFGGSAPTGDKGMLNTVLDNLRTSTIWITNTPAGALDESSRRRFDYSICFEPLNSEQRKRIWQNNIARLKLGRLILLRQVEEFAALYPVSAGGIAQTLENLARLKPRRAEVPALVEQLMKPHCELLGIRLADDKLLPSKDYSLEGLNLHGDVELSRIVEAVRAFQNQKGAADPDRPRMNLLLSGPPGTGKTEFVKHLGDILKTKVNVVMGSDLLDKYVGGTEQNIKRAFERAEAEHAILFLDEIDGLVQNRAGASHTWEVTQVNELLHQMENFNGVMVGATNFSKNLDPAIHRRFTFKLEFDYLDDRGKELFFERMFHTALTPAERARLHRIPRLAPGDFRTVRQSLYYYGGEITNEQRLAALERETAIKKATDFGPGNRIGF